MGEPIEKRLESESELQRALERQEFQLHYQPIVGLEREQIVGFEALLRWMHPGRGVIYPVEFLSLAETTNLIVPLTQWTLREVCRQIGRWQAGLGGTLPLTISVNLSVQYLTQNDLTREVEDLASANQLNFYTLRFELNETQILSNPELLTRIFSELKEKGMGGIIDNFGSGDLSVRHLVRLPVCALKMDRSVVSNLPSDPQNRSIARAIISLGHSLGLEVIAKGVEKAEELHVLRDMECEYAQGFYFSPPQDPDAAFLLLSETMQTNRMEEVEVSRLEPFDFFSGLHPEDLHEIVQSCKELAVLADTLIIRQGQVGNRIYFLEEGSVAIYKGSGETRHFLRTLRAPAVVGEMAVVDPERIRTADVRSLTDLRLLSIPIPTFLSFLRRFPALGNNLRKLLAEQSGVNLPSGSLWARRLSGRMKLED
ncbi:MAG: EAL domain-containing protein [Terriglobia bacterium]